MRPLLRLCSLLTLACISSGCSIIVPEVSTMPVVHNPFPQLSRVAVTPFINLSDEPTVNGREFALAYFAELQAVPGFEVVPLGVVEEAMIDERIDLSDPAEARRLANVLGVDAVVVGAVTDYSPYYPPRCGMRVEWYAANQGFHEIPAGYGLPWGTPDEEYIPQEVVFEAEMALARAQLETQSPACADAPPAMPSVDASPLPYQDLRDLRPHPPQSDVAPSNEEQPDPFLDNATDMHEERLPSPSDDPSRVAPEQRDLKRTEGNDASAQLRIDRHDDGNEVAWRPQRQASFKVPIERSPSSLSSDAISTDVVIDTGSENNFAAALPPDWPDPRGFVPPGPSPVRPPCVPNDGPVMTHTRIFLGHDPEFTAALAAYVDFRDDARFGGWRSYLERSDDFIRFCCHLHISEMLSARGGATETRVVRHWSNCR